MRLLPSKVHFRLRSVEACQFELHVLLQPRSDLFAAFQRSLSDEHQAVLARSAAGDFRASDDQLRAAQCDMQSEDVQESAGSGTQRCKHTRPLCTWSLEGQRDASNRIMINAVDERSDIEDEVQLGRTLLEEQCCTCHGLQPQLMGRSSDDVTQHRNIGTAHRVVQRVHVSASHN